MPAEDINDVLIVFVYTNLAAITAGEVVAATVQQQQFLTVPVLNSFGALPVPPDIAQLTEDFFATTAAIAITST